MSQAHLCNHAQPHRQVPASRLKRLCRQMLATCVAFAKGEQRLLPFLLMYVFLCLVVFPLFLFSIRRAVSILSDAQIMTGLLCLIACLQCVLVRGLWRVASHPSYSRWMFYVVRYFSVVVLLNAFPVIVQSVGVLLNLIDPLASQEVRQTFENLLTKMDIKR